MSNVDSSDHNTLFHFQSNSDDLGEKLPNFLELRNRFLICICGNSFYYQLISEVIQSVYNQF